MKSPFYFVVICWLLAACAEAGQSAVQGPSLTLLDVVQAAVTAHPDVEIERQQVAIQDALRRQASSTFDSMLSAGVDQGRAYAASPAPAGDYALTPSNTSSLALSLSRLLRNGMSVRGATSLDRITSPHAFLNGLTVSHTNVEVVVPLRRGMGREVTTAPERANTLERNAAEYDLRHVMASRVATAASSYWSVVAAQRRLAVTSASAERGAVLVDNVRTLIAADQVPASEVASARANLADRQAARVAAEQRQLEAGLQLMLDMGVPAERLSGVAASDEFPAPPAAALPPERTDDVQRFVDTALDRRADYAAARARVDAARVLRDAERNRLLPEVNLSLDVGYRGLTEGRALTRYFAGVASQVNGPDVVGRISYQFPMQNRLAVGRLDQAEATLRQAQLREADVQRNVQAAVAAAYSAWRNATLVLQKAQESVEAFQTAMAGERDKLALGVGSIVNLLTIEDRLTTAADREVGAWLSYALALVRFRLATGSLVPATGPVSPPDQSTLTTFPFPLSTAKE